MTDRPAYSRAARLRVRLAAEAADIADATRAMVPTVNDDAARPGETAERARRVALDADRLLTLAIAYERRKGTSWEEIGERLGISKQAAHERYANRVKFIDDAVLVAWLLGDQPRAEEGIDADQIGHLDRWARARTIDASDRIGEDADHMVSANLAPMCTTEQKVMVTAAAELLATERADRPIGRSSPETVVGAADLAALELGYARRKVELYERLAAQEAERPGSTGNDADELHDLLTGARARLAEMENAGDETK